MGLHMVVNMRHVEEDLVEEDLVEEDLVEDPVQPLL